MNASALASDLRADGLKSLREPSKTTKYNRGSINSRMLLLSMATHSDPRSFRSRRGSALASWPWRVRSQSECRAPAARYRHVSARPRESASSVSANGCSVGAQPQGWPSWEQTPCPYCVIFTAVQPSDENSRMSADITEVLPIFRV